VLGFTPTLGQVRVATLGHLNMASLKELGAMVDGMNLKEVPLHHICEGCVKGKHQKTSFPKDGTTRA